MTGLVRKTTLFTVCGLVVAGAAMAGVPSPANSQAPCVILMDFPNSQNSVGVNPAICSVPSLKVVVRDALNNPVSGSDVVLDFTACVGWGSNIELASTQPDLAVTTSCGGKTVLKTTNALGEVCFTVIGASTQFVAASSTLPSTYTGLPDRNIGPTAGEVCCKIYASGQLLATKMVIVNRYNLDGSALIANNVNSGDRGYVQDAEGYFGSGGPPPAFSAPYYRTYPDYDCNGLVNAGDRALMLDAEGNDNGSADEVYAGAYCP